MKTRLALIGIAGLTLLASAAPHTWILKNGLSVEGDYFSSGTTIVVLKRSGTNYLLNISDLSTNELRYLAEMQFAQRQARLDAEAKQMTQAGMIEFSATLIENFPEKVRYKQGWMDATFYGFDPDAGRSPEIDLGFVVTDSEGKDYLHCVVVKSLHGSNWPNDMGQGDKPNPLVGVITNLKHGDKVRFYGSVSDRGPLSTDYTELFFYIDRIQTIESAAEKKAREDDSDK